MKRLNEFISGIDPKLLYTKGPVNQQDIMKAESLLNGCFGNELREYLAIYGAISYESIELYGLGFSDSYYYNIIQGTNRLRKMGLPMNYYPIYDLGDGHFSVVSKDDQVYEWHFYESPVTRKVSDSLVDYIVDLFRSQR